MDISKVIKVGNSLALTIPKQMLMAAGILKGDYVLITLREDGLRINKMPEFGHGSKGNIDR